MKNPKLNAEGYKDTTAYLGMRNVIREEKEIDKRAGNLLKVLKYIICVAGFELIGRVQLRDNKTGKEYR